MSVYKQLIIGKFDLPLDVINIIKDYAFCNLVEKLKDAKKQINNYIEMKKINHTTQFIWILEDKVRLILAEFCPQCGNYRWSYTILVPNKIICFCQFHYYINL